MIKNKDEKKPQRWRCALLVSPQKSGKGPNKVDEIKRSQEKME
jgi:hypothetical protein